MNRLLSLSVFAVALLAAFPSHAALPSSNPQPNLLSIGGGWFDINENSPRKEAVDFRLEHRWGMSLLPKAFRSTASWDKWFQIHPMAGLEMTSRAQTYGFGGFVFDIMPHKNIVISPNVVVGLYHPGYGKRLGSFVEFRSTFEAGWRFNNNVRLTAFLSHISNAGITKYNPGGNSAGAYLHIPTSMLF